MSRSRFAIRRNKAARGRYLAEVEAFRQRVLAAVMEIGLSVVTSGAAEDVVVGYVTLAGFNDSEITGRTMIDTAGNQFKLVAPNVIKTGAVTTNSTVDPLPEITIRFDLLYGLSVTGSAGITVSASAPSDLTADVPAFHKVMLTDVIPTLAADLASVPDGNAVTISKTAGPIELTTCDVYVPGTNVFGAPSPTFDGVNPDSEWNLWTEDGQAMTMAPDYSEAEGNGVGARGTTSEETVKPTISLLSPWFHRIAGERYVVIVRAKSEDASGADNMEYVRGYFGGAVLTVTERTSIRAQDFGGRWQWYHDVYVFEIDPALYLAYGTDSTRELNLFLRAKCTDAAIATNLIGRWTKGYTLTTNTAQWNIFGKRNFVFFPCATPHDLLVHVDPTAGADSKPGGVYPSVNAIFRNEGDALAYTRGLTVNGLALTRADLINCPSPDPISAKAPELRRVAAGATAPVSRTLDNVGQRGWNTFTLADGVEEAEIGRPAWDFTTTASTVGHKWQPSRSALRFVGNYVFNLDYFTGFDIPNKYGGSMGVWLDGFRTRTTVHNLVTELDDWGGCRNSLFVHATTVGGGFVTNARDASFVGTEGTWICGKNVRGWGPAGISEDLYNRAWAVDGDIILNADISVPRTYFPAITFSAIPADRRVVKFGNLGGTGAQIVVIQTLAGVELDRLDLTAGSTDNRLRLRISDVVDWINGHAGYTCVSNVTPNDRVTDRAAVFIVFSEYVTDANKATVKFRTFIDRHFDFRQFNLPGQMTHNCSYNAIRMFNVTWCQSNFADWTNYNIVISNVYTDNQPFSNKAQWQYSTPPSSTSGNPIYFYNVRTRYMSSADEQFNLRNQTPIDPSTQVFASSQVVGSYFGSFAWWDDAAATAYPVLRVCHFAFGYADKGAQVADRTTSGGSTAENVPGKANRDPRPGGALLLPANMEPPLEAFDCQGIKRNTVSSHKGAATLGLPNGAITKAEAINLQAVSCTEDVGDALASVSISWMSGAGETGSLVTKRIDVNVTDPTAV